MYLLPAKKEPPENGVLFGCHILLKNRDGIMVNTESFAGG